jgi:hypothetical protein
MGTGPAARGEFPRASIDLGLVGGSALLRGLLFCSARGQVALAALIPGLAGGRAVSHHARDRVDFGVISDVAAAFCHCGLTPLSPTLGGGGYGGLEPVLKRDPDLGSGAGKPGCEAGLGLLGGPEFLAELLPAGGVSLGDSVQLV